MLSAGKTIYLRVHVIYSEIATYRESEIHTVADPYIQRFRNSYIERSIYSYIQKFIDPHIQHSYIHISRQRCCCRRRPAVVATLQGTAQQLLQLFSAGPIVLSSKYEDS